MSELENQNTENPFLKFTTGLNYIREDYAYAMDELGLNKDQAFAFAYDENDAALYSTNASIKFIAYIALFYYAYEYKVTFYNNDPFDEDAFKELKAAYKDFYSDEENLKRIPDMQAEESQKIIQIVKDNYVESDK